MEKDCSTCYHRSKTIVDKPCDSCVVSKCSENVVGRVYTKWQPAHSCSTCKHCDKKITEEPCFDCDVRTRNDKWEERE